MAQTHGSTQQVPYQDPYEDETIKLIERLTGLPDQLEVISIVPRTEERASYLESWLLARRVYNHPSIISYFQIRTLTSSTPIRYQKSDLLLKILSFENSYEELGEQLKKVLTGHRFLFFIDMLWLNKWDDLKKYFPDNGNGSRIVFCALSHVSLVILNQPRPQPQPQPRGVQLYLVGAQEEVKIISDDDDGSSSIAMNSSGSSVKEEMMVGCGDEVMKLVDRLTGLLKKQLEVIPIVGMPGLGKTKLHGLSVPYEDEAIKLIESCGSSRYCHPTHQVPYQDPYEDETYKLIERLTGLPDQLEVISIVPRRRWPEESASYLEPSELARQVYNHRSIISYFQIRTLTTFSILNQKSDLLLEILSSIVDRPTYISLRNSDEELGEQLKKVLTGHRFLIFMDKSLLNNSFWCDLKKYFPDNGNGSRIVFCALSLDLLSQLQPQPQPRGVQLYFVGAQEEVKIISDGSGSSVKKEMMVGCGDEVMKLVDRLTGLQKKQLEVIPIVGMPGLGKTTLARQVYDHPNVVYHFHVRAWTRVSQVYQMRDLLLGILSSIVELTDEIYKMSNQKLLELLKKCLLGHRYLIVMDDMWDNRAWNDLQRSFPNHNNGSKIIFTSRLAEVALHAQGNSVHYLRFLTPDESWKLLCQKVFQRKHCPRQLMEIGMQITEKCKGLPLAIVVIAGILANEKTLTWWRQVAKSVSSYIVSNPERYLDTLALSYRHLPPHLKPCFLYLGAFLEDREIPVQKLILLWVSEGFIRHSGSKRLEDVAEDYLMDLINRSLVIVSKKGSAGGIKSCIMHDLLRELCLRKFKEENFMQQLHKYGENSTPTSSFTEKPGRVCIYSAPSHHSSLMPFAPNATSLLYFAVDVLPDFTSFICQAFMFLRVLDLVSIKILLFPSEIIQLIELRYIAIQAEVGSPSSSISSLQYLETLIISSRNNVTLPRNTWKMVNLRHLCIKLGVNEIEKPSFEEVQDDGHPLILENLQTLSFVCPSRYCKDILERSPRLRKLGFCGPLISESRDLRFPVINYSDQLETLKLFNTAFYREASSSCNPYMFPDRLKRLTLTNTALAWNEMWTLGMLPNLEVLKLKLHACIGRQWETSEEGFLRLKFLKFQDLDIVQWIASSNHFPRLEHLVLHGCRELEEIPSSLGDIPTLEMIEVRWCSETATYSAHAIKKDQENKGNDCVKVITKGRRG